MEPRGSSEPAAELPAGPEVAPEKGQQASKNNAPPPPSAALGAGVFAVQAPPPSRSRKTSARVTDSAAPRPGAGGV